MQNQVSELLRASLVLSISVVIWTIGSRVWGSCSGPRGAATATARSQTWRLTLNFTKVKPSHNHHNNDFLYIPGLATQPLESWIVGQSNSQTETKKNCNSCWTENGKLWTNVCFILWAEQSRLVAINHHKEAIWCIQMHKWLHCAMGGVAVESEQYFLSQQIQIKMTIGA